MRFAVVGATGQTGMELVKQALAANHQITAIVRNPSKMTITNDNLSVVEANIFDPESLSAKIEGHDAVISCLGFPVEKKVTGYTEATKALVTAMEEKSVKRLVMCHSWYTEEGSRANCPWFLRWTLIPYIRPVLDNMYETEKYLESLTNDIDYTVVRPPGLTTGPVTDKEFQVAEDKYDVPGAKSRMVRADVARFMLNCAEKADYKKKMVSIAQ